MTTTGVHVPVLGEETVELLITDLEGLYIDGTVGAGGHSELLLQRVTGSVLGIDRDGEAVLAARERLRRYPNFTARQGDYRTVLTALGKEQPVGVLLDLGLSSLQLDAPQRGFAWRTDGPLDMRFDQQAPLTAAAIVNQWEGPELARIFGAWGEARFARPVAKAIVRRRARQPLATTGDVREVVTSVTPPGKVRAKELARIFQALRIAVNRELEGLAEALDNWCDTLPPGGRLAVIAYHSLEDRTVKRVFKARAAACTCPPRLAVCRCGRQPDIRIVTSSAVQASRREIDGNPRSRSARLRVAEKVMQEGTEGTGTVKK